MAIDPQVPHPALRRSGHPAVAMPCFSGFPAIWSLACAGCLALVPAAAAAPDRTPRQMERLGRGVVAIREPDGKVFVSWRLLATDPAGLAFNLYRLTEQSPDRQPVKLNPAPLTGATWFTDRPAVAATRLAYCVRPVWNGRELASSAPFLMAADAPPQPYLTLPLQPVAGYQPGDASAGDLDGDGEYEIVLMQNGRTADNSRGGLTDPPVLQAYKLDGTLLWQLNLGPNIRGGAHYSPFLVYDFDGDGRAELACKTADGTIDGQGKVLGDPAARHVNPAGHILSGPEFLTVFSGRTGAALATTDYVPPRHPTTTHPSPAQLNAVWGDNYGNRSERYLAGVAYLDGVRPSLVMCRGYYTRSVLAAWDWRDGKLTQRWVFDSESSAANRNFRGQGCHSLSVADVDADGRDEIVYGAAVIDDDGTGLYSTGWGHGDALHVSDLDPGNPGLEVLSIQEHFGPEGMNLRDARTGRPRFLIPSTAENRSRGDRGEGPVRGASFNLDPRHPGNESWAFGAGLSGLYDVRGRKISERTPRSCNFAVWWDGDLLRELLDRNRVTKWNWTTATETTLLDATGAMAINGSKATPILSADLCGDWREEIILRATDGKSLRLYTTTFPTKHRLFTLMHDPQYRLAVAWQNGGYNQPPHPGFALDEALPLPGRPNITTAPSPVPASPAPK